MRHRFVYCIPITVIVASCLCEGSALSQAGANSNSIASSSLSARTMTVDSALKLSGSTNSTDRESAFHVLITERSKFVNSTIDRLRKAASLDDKMDAAKILGYCRANEAVDDLVSRLDLENAWHPPPFGTVTPEESMFFTLPISAALWKVGEPAVKPLMNEIAEGPSDSIMRKCVSICRAIEGDDVTAFRIGRAMERVENADAKKYFATALSVLNELKAGHVFRDELWSDGRGQ